MKPTILPHNEETENLVLGTIMGDRGALDEVREIITEDCFYHNFNRMVYRTIIALDKAGKRPDMIAVRNELMGKVNDEDLWLVAKIGSNHCFDIYQHAASLFDMAVKRKYYAIGQKLMSRVNTFEDVQEVVEETIKELQDLFASKSADVSTMYQVVDSVYNIINANVNSNGMTTGTMTGFKEIDRRGGFHNSDLIIIAADSSQGKTSLAVSLCLNAASSGAKIAFYSMEMRSEQLAARMMAVRSGIPASEIMYTPLNAAQIREVDGIISSLVGLGIYFDDRDSSNIDVIISSIRMMKKRYDINGAVVDYLQILNVNMKGVNKEQQLGDVSRRLKNLAKELNIWIIALSQLSRDKVDPQPALSRLRDSGQIAEAADVVMLIYRPEYYNLSKKYPDPFANVSTENTAMIDIAKGRNIGLARFIVGFNKRTTHFYELETIPHINQAMALQEDKPF